jgi:hypothetical protein
MKEIIIKDGIKYFKPKKGGLLRYQKSIEMFAGVYCLTDLSNGKKYVGSSKHVLRRINGYKNLNNKKGVIRLIKDVNNIKMEVIERITDEKILLERELFWIKELNSVYPYGYNKRCPIMQNYINDDCYSNSKKIRK